MTTTAEAATTAERTGRRRPDRTNLALYLVGTGTWFASMGVQIVLFAWLVTIELHETPEKVGLAQFSLMIPTLCLMLFAGVIADRVGGGRVAVLAQGGAVLPVVALALVVGAETLVYPLLIGYALMMGTAQAFVTPARDGMLPLVAGERIQRTVVLASLVQFGVQIVGFSLAGMADRLGPEPVLAVQAVLLAIGAAAFWRLGGRLRRQAATSRITQGAPPPTRMLTSLKEGLATVFASPAMRAVTVLNVCIGLFFMGSFQVGVPLLVREAHGGTPAQLAVVNGVHMAGIVLTTLTLLQLGDVDRRGRALILGILLGAVGLAGVGLATSFYGLLFFNFLWGVCGGVVMSMSRTIMQEAAPADRRGRVMAFFSLSFMGAGPLGALISGFLVDAFGAHLALAISGAIIASCALVVALRSTLWRLALIPV